MIVEQLISSRTTELFPSRPKSDISKRLTLDEFAHIIRASEKPAYLEEYPTLFGNVVLIRCGRHVYCGSSSFEKNWMKNIIHTLNDTGETKLFTRVVIR